MSNLSSRPWIALLSLVLAAGFAPAGPAQTWRSSVDTLEQEGSGSSLFPSVSADGRYCVFQSQSKDLVPNDTNSAWDIFVRDRKVGTTNRINLSDTGAEANSDSFDASFSDDGRYVAFMSRASNLVVGDNNGKEDVFVRDLVTSTTVLVSRDSNGKLGQDDSGDPAISGDGRYIAFVSKANNLVQGDPNGVPDVFVHDLTTGATVIASITPFGTSGNAGSYNPVISTDGQFVAFSSDASNIGASDINFLRDVYHRDLVNNVTTLVSVVSSIQSDGDSDYPAISGDGTRVVYDSTSTNLGGDSNPGHDIFLKNVQTGTLNIVSVDGNGQQQSGACRHPDIDAAGEVVSFTTWSSNLVAGDTNSVEDVIVRNLGDGTTKRRSVTYTSGQSNQRSDWSALSASGNYVAFSSDATNLVLGDTNNQSDVFMNGKSLFFEYVPLVLYEFDPFQITVYPGIQGDPVMLLITNVSGVPFVRVLLTGKFDPRGQFGMSGKTPPGFAGLDITHVAIGKNFVGNFQVTDPVVVSLR